ncbi:MAG: DUF4426 domain-containing protein [Pseudomonas sp.]|jgi:hypothetical protein|uniref:DUF4426 domain-containing protein n=1 Tax=Pseudomonas sp. TaxID=306 RepID=UPI00238EF3EA|nr:DUF4426 domain-containing protein [Pseudomonas sp.]MDE1197505.1 DUF4426 domain-containing protein [Pseudomonas sp.]
MARLIVMLGVLFALSGPVMAADNARPERQEQFGDLTIHYNAFASSILQPSVAQATGLIRSKGQAAINITAIKGGKTVPASVSGSVQDLTGRKKPLTFKQISEQGAVNYIAQFAVEPDTSEFYTFTIDVKAGDGDAHTLSFNQQIYTDQ